MKIGLIERLVSPCLQRAREKVVVSAWKTADSHSNEAGFGLLSKPEWPDLLRERHALIKERDANIVISCRRGCPQENFMWHDTCPNRRPRLSLAGFLEKAVGNEPREHAF